MSAIQNHIETFENLNFSFENMSKRTSIIGILPLQANTNFDKDEKGVDRYWCQLVSQFKSSYTRTDEHGQQFDDNASLKTLVIKFPMDYLQDHEISSSNFKDLFDTHFVGKKFLFLPVSEEKQSFQNQGDKRIPIKNQSEMQIDTSFDLRALFQDIEKQKAEKNSKGLLENDKKPVGAK